MYQRENEILCFIRLKGLHLRRTDGVRRFARYTVMIAYENRSKHSPQDFLGQLQSKKRINVTVRLDGK